MRAHEEDEEDVDQVLRVPDKLNVCQWIVVGTLYAIFLYLVVFIIYISATWNKDRTNEYT